MGKPTGFMEYARELPEDRPAERRVGDWQEFHQSLPEDRLRAQGSRCMDCGVPFCHTGMLIAGMASGCPLSNLIPEVNDLVYRGMWKEALGRLLATNPFPEFTGKVCPAPCEGSCTLGAHDPPVTIKNIEHAVIEMGYRKRWIVARPPSLRTGKRVAVVGSGPSGLACADGLNRAGHSVTVFERADRVGGLLMYGIPNMKLDKKIVQRRLDLMAAEGIQFVTGTEIGVDVPAERVVAEHDAVVLCGGATRPRDLAIEGRELPGVHFAMEFLGGSTRSLLDRSPAALSARGKDVVVIGGGDTGTDCVATSVRQGCRGVTQLEIMDRPPDERQPDNPWPQWPRVHRVDYGHEEAAALFGTDPRTFLTTATRFVGDASGVSGVETVRVEWVRDPSGRMQPRQVPGTERTLPAQLVLLSLGFLGPEQWLLEQLGVERDARSNARAGDDNFATSVEGVFAAGDMRRGQSLVVWAIREGREAARAVDRYLMGRE